MEKSINKVLIYIFCLFMFVGAIDTAYVIFDAISGKAISIWSFKPPNFAGLKTVKLPKNKLDSLAITDSLFNLKEIE